MILADTNILGTLARVKRIELLLGTCLVKTRSACVRRSMLNSWQECVPGREFPQPAVDLVEKGRIKLVALTADEILGRQKLPTSLDSGEAESITVCQTRGAAFLTNDRRARNFCLDQGIEVFDLIDMLRALWKPAAPRPAVLSLVRDGRPTSVIVTNGRPGEGQTQAASELQEHIRLMSGATVAIVKENELGSTLPDTLVLVGPSNLARKHGVDTEELEPETFVVKTDGNALILAGEDGGGKSNARTGTLWAVYDFLQDQLGCRWIWPGKIGQVVPKRDTIEVPALDIRETPHIKIRDFRAVNQEKHRVGYENEGLGRYFDLGVVYAQLAEDERVWMQRMRMGRSFRLSAGHAFTDWWEKYGESDPQIFALQPNGQRGPRKSDRPDFVKMCVSNPDLWELQLAPLKEAAAKGAKGLSLNACENDGSGGFCVCPRCRQWDAGSTDPAGSREVEDGSEVDRDSPDRDGELPESLSNRYVRWYNELAVRARALDPEARVIAYAYSRYRSPPNRVAKIEPNVWIGYVGFNAYPRSAEYRQMSIDEWLGWSRLGATVFLRSNSLFYCGEGAPLVVSQQVAEDLKFQVEHGLRATDFDCLQGCWATTGTSYYVLARLLWDTGADPDAVLDEFYGAFGPAGPVVKEYFDFWEAFTVRLGTDPSFSELNRTDRMRAYPKVYTERVFSQARTILAKAQPLLAHASAEERERFRNVELGLEHGRLLVNALDDGKTSTGQAGQELLAFRREIAPRNVVNVYWTTSKEMRYRVFE